MVRETIIETDDSEEELTETERLELEKEQELDQAIAAYGGDSGAKIYVYHLQGSDNRKGEFVDSFDTDAYTHDELMRKLRDEYNGGRFKIQIRDAKGIVRRQTNVAVKEKPKMLEPEKQDNNFQSVLLALQSSSEKASRETRELMMQMQQQSMVAQQENMKLVIELVRNNRPDPKPDMSVKDIIELMAIMKGMEGDKKDPLDMMLKGIELAKDLNSGGDENLLQTAIKTFGGPIAEMSKQMAHPGIMQAPAPANVGYQTSPPGGPYQAGPLNAPPQPTHNQPPQDGDDMNLKLMKFIPVFNQVIRGAQAGTDPEVYANLILDELPLDLVKEFIVDENQYNQLYTMQPQLVPLKQWLDNCRGIVIEFIAEGVPTDDNTNTNGEPGTHVHQSAPTEPATTPGQPSASDLPGTYESEQFSQ